MNFKRFIGKIKMSSLCLFSVATLSGCSLYGNDLFGPNYFQFNDDFYDYETTTENFARSDEMKIENTSDLDENGGSDLSERKFDHVNSEYYPELDFYNMKSRGFLKILHNFKTYQQTSENSSAEACIVSILDWYGKKGDTTEQKLCELINAGKTDKGTTIAQVVDTFNAIGGFNVVSTIDILKQEREQGNRNVDYSKYFNKNTIIEQIKNKTPIMVCSGSKYAQWSVLIGYDDMGTDAIADDVIITMNTYDINDHNQDGYEIVSAQKFFDNFSTGYFFDDNELNDYLFVIAKPIQS